jgi:hypothetical protein
VFFITGDQTALIVAESLAASKYSWLHGLDSSISVELDKVFVSVLKFVVNNSNLNVPIRSRSYTTFESLKSNVVNANLKLKSYSLDASPITTFKTASLLNLLREVSVLTVCSKCSVRTKYLSIR